MSGMAISSTPAAPHIWLEQGPCVVCCNCKLYKIICLLMDRYYSSSVLWLSSPQTLTESLCKTVLSPAASSLLQLLWYRLLLPRLLLQPVAAAATAVAVLALTARGALSAVRHHMAALYLSAPLKERTPSEKVTSGWKNLVL